jgi:hypothetical protein
VKFRSVVFCLAALHITAAFGLSSNEDWNTSKGGAVVGGGLFWLLGIDLCLGEIKITFEDLTSAFVGSLLLCRRVAADPQTRQAAEPEALKDPSRRPYCLNGRGQGKSRAIFA